MGSAINSKSDNIPDFSFDCERNSKRISVEFWICGKLPNWENTCIHFKVLNISRNGVGLRMESVYVDGNEEGGVLQQLVGKETRMQFAGSKETCFFDECKNCNTWNELEYYNFLNLTGNIMWTLADRCGVRFLESLTETDHELIDELGIKYFD